MKPIHALMNQNTRILHQKAVTADHRNAVLHVTELLFQRWQKTHNWSHPANSAANSDTGNYFAIHP